MRRIVVMNHVTLDGVMQAPGRADETPAADSNMVAGRRRTQTRSSAGRLSSGWPAAADCSLDDGRMRT